jgi:cobalt-zinc-cadmium efflux system protein
MSGSHHHHGHDHHGHGHHGHSHGHGHSHAPPADPGRAFAIGIALNLVFVIIEAGYGIFADSIALVADAGHNLSDVLGLALAWGGATLAKRAASKRFTYGLRGSTILAALANALLLIAALGAIAWAALSRLAQPLPVEGGVVMAVAGVGIVVNVISALLFMRGQKHDLNVRGAYLHMVSDALVSVGVVVSGGLILLTGKNWIDPLVSLIVVGLIFWQTLGLLKDTVAMALAGVPRGVDFDEVQAALLGLDGVSDVHDLHIWGVSTSETVLTAHLVVPGGADDAFVMHAASVVREQFNIGHVTLQIERAHTGDGCC